MIIIKRLDYISLTGPQTMCVFKVASSGSAQFNKPPQGGKSCLLTHWNFEAPDEQKLDPAVVVQWTVSHQTSCDKSSHDLLLLRT